MKNFDGSVLFLDRSDINTDEIIPAKYLTEITKEALKPNLLEDLSLEGFDPKRDIQEKSFIITRDNFGCGSSREHAPWALEVNGIHGVLAPSFARIFRQNMFNCGMIAVEIDSAEIDELFDLFSETGAVVETLWDESILVFTNGESSKKVAFEINPFDKSLVEAGGWVDYADTHY